MTISSCSSVPWQQLARTMSVTQVRKPPGAQRDDGLTHGTQAREKAPGGAGSGRPQEAVTEGGVGLDEVLDLTARGARAAQLLEDAQAYDLVGAQSVALDDLGPAEQVALEEVEAELLAGLQLLAGLDLLGQQLDAELRIVADGVRQLGRA